MEGNKEYYAFISYKSEDVEWAIWLQHELEHYHLPTSFNGRTDIRQELRPVFRDIDELAAGKKGTEILYIFFGIHTANAVRLAERLLEQQRAKAA